MKIVVDRDIPFLQEALRKEWPEAEVVALKGADISAADVADADALIVRTRTRCDAALLSGSNVRLVGTATIGTDHIDIPWCESAGIEVVSAPGCNAPAVMQYVASSLHAAGFDPRRHTLGVVGKGHIGSLVTDLYRSAGATVLVCDPPRAERGETDEQYLELGKLLESCDAVTFHVPYTTGGAHPTHRLLRGALPERLMAVVNASRGNVIDATYLLEEAGHKKFIIDTWPFEEGPSEKRGAGWTEEERNRMIGNAFIATPHIAGYSREGKARATEAMLEALRRFGGKPSRPRAAEPGTYHLEEVIASYDPTVDSRALKLQPGEFEKLRAQHLRPEPERH